MQHLQVIGAVAWALLGPKELYKLAQQAGQFLGEWQQLGRQAQSTFKDALESELGNDLMGKAQAASTEASSIAQKMSTDLQTDLRSKARAASRTTAAAHLRPPPPRTCDQRNHRDCTCHCTRQCTPPRPRC